MHCSSRSCSNNEGSFIHANLSSPWPPLALCRTKKPHLSHNKPQHDLTRVGDLSKRLRRLYVRTQDVSSGGSLVNPSPKPSASTRVGFLLHMGQSLLRSSEALSQRMRFQRWPEEMGRAPCMCCPLCRSPSPTLCCTSVHSVSFSGTCRGQHNTISDTSGCCSPTRM